MRLYKILMRSYALRIERRSFSFTIPLTLYGPEHLFYDSPAQMKSMIPFKFYTDLSKSEPRLNLNNLSRYQTALRQYVRRSTLYVTTHQSLSRIVFLVKPVARVYPHKACQQQLGA
jgi:hypothetical protein